jgi:ATP-binding cassette, subfamily G (WHITE), eye pigment precursor transporter
MIGGTMQKGISGGERKRTSIGYELVSDPKCILLDEPTSGLDSFTAFSIINLLREICKKLNKTIIFTVHQPSTDIYELFDRVMLLVEGRFIYQGPKTQIISYFTDIGFKCP